MKNVPHDSNTLTTGGQNLLPASPVCQSNPYSPYKRVMSPVHLYRVARLHDILMSVARTSRQWATRQQMRLVEDSFREGEARFAILKLRQIETTGAQNDSEQILCALGDKLGVAALFFADDCDFVGDFGTKAAQFRLQMRHALDLVLKALEVVPGLFMWFMVRITGQ